LGGQIMQKSWYSCILGGQNIKQSCFAYRNSSCKTP
jgi:hypothetical protein